VHGLSHGTSPQCDDRVLSHQVFATLAECCYLGSDVGIAEAQEKNILGARFKLVFG
jgi:hypothetical protein